MKSENEIRECEFRIPHTPHAMSYTHTPCPIPCTYTPPCTYTMSYTLYLYSYTYTPHAMSYTLFSIPSALYPPPSPPPSPQT
jgi:hypothetical protein